MSQEREHTRFSPSRSEQFFLCPGSVNLLARTPARPTSIYAEEGIRAHTILEAGLRNGCRTAKKAIECSVHCMDEDFEDGLIPAITDALQYIWEIYDNLNATHGDAQMFIEVRVDPPISSAPGEAAGYCDVALYSAKARHLWVIDYKHGVGISKAVVGNTQVKQYAAGFLYDDQALVDKNNVDTVTLVIIQPRAFHVDGDIREYDTTPLELADYLIELDENIEKCMKPDAPLIPGLEQCRFCDARATCPAIEAKALATVSDQFRTIRDVRAPNLPDVNSLDPQRLSYIKQMMPLIKAWFDDVDKLIYELNMNGVHVPGTKLVEADAKREWYEQDEVKRANELAALIGCEPTDLYRIKFETITAAQQMVVSAFKARVSKGRKKQAAEEARQLFAYFTIKQSSGNLTVVLDDDPRPPANRALTSFGQIAGLLPPSTPKGE